MNKNIVAVLCVLAAASVAWAVKPATWTHTTEAHFSAGELTKTVVTSLGEVKLAKALETLVEPGEKIGMISTAAIDRRGRLYVAAAPQATVYRLEKNKLVEFAKLPGVMVRSLFFAKGKLIAGTCGKKAGIYRIDRKGKVKKVWADKKVTYVWSIVPGPRGSFYAATGAEGRIYHVKSDGKATVIYDSDEKNILSLAAGAKGMLYAGTGEKGLIIEVDPAGKKGRILYDAAEREISCLLVDADGVLYAATSDSSKASADGEAPSNEVKGKPDKSPPTKPARKTTTRPAGKATTKPASGPASGPAETPTTRPAGTKRTRPPAATAEVRKVPTTGSAKARPTPSVDLPPNMPEEIKRLIETKKVESVKEVPKPPEKPKTKTAPRQAPPRVVRRPTRKAAPRPSRPTRAPSGKGNAVYRIDKEGFVRSIFRRPVTILAMTMHGGALVLGTGHGGQVFTVDTDGDSICAVAKVDPKDITVLAGGADGRLYVGTASSGGIFSLGKGHAAKGTYLSKVLDAKQIARWGTMGVRAEVPPGCGLTIATRSGNVAKPDEKTWSDFSAEAPVGTGWTSIACPAGRFLQYRLTLASTGQATAAVDKVQLVYQVGNLPPVTPAVKVMPSPKPAPPSRGSSSGGPMPMRYRIIQTKASDPNGDNLHYAVHYRRAGHRMWIKLVEKSTKSVYAWDTFGVPDGTYEVRVEVSDVPSNPPSAALTASRISRPVVVDNTRPVLADLLVKPLGKGEVGLSGTAADKMGRIRRIDYAVDSNEEWVRVLPADGICDSQRETFSTTISEIEPGTHRIAVRVSDEYGNTGYASVEVTVGK